jgi:hypothetical protein
MTRAEAARIHEQMLAVKVWIEHFQADAAAGLVPSKSCLTAAHAHAESALTLLDRVEQKEAA